LPLTKEEEFKLADEEYRRFETLRFVGSLLLIVGYGIVAFDVSSVASVPNYSGALFSLVGLAAASVALFGLFLLLYSMVRMKDAFTSLEQETRHFLRNSTKALASYVSRKRKRDRKRAVSQLKNVANVIDRWSGGNLSYLRTDEDKISNFAKVFREKLVPAVAKATPEEANGYYGWLSGTENNILNMEESSLDAWTPWLQGLKAEPLASVKRRHLITMTLNAGVVAIIAIIGYEIFLLVKALPGATFDGPIVAAAGIVWGPGFTAYLTWAVQRYMPKRESVEKVQKET